ncbi:aminotransferase class I/II-fold pyridoxal phosphate-dependent enzyme [Candidatus Uhrbacteria bacterium]|nr:aminotransferase class I/II-fold pyridoxal phosphate-dependent enzyme [Candidatus Uhrbacteria bacterium]
MFSSLPLLPPDPLFQLTADFRKETNPNKINLGIGIYATEAGQSFVMPVVERAARQMPTNNFDYAPIGGVTEFLEATGRLVFGQRFDHATFASQATCGGTQACWLFGQLAARAGYARLMLPTPTWVNHVNIFSSLSIETCAHLRDDGSVNVEAYQEAIERVTHPTILLLHGGPTHNPTGRNLTLDNLRHLIPLLQSRPVFVLVDFAYLGLGEGVEQDTQGVRLLCEELENIAVAVSFSKNATLYCHRTGALFVKAREKLLVESHARAVIRASISNPPAWGQYIMRDILTHSLSEWCQHVDDMRESIDRRREALVSEVPLLTSIQDTRGLFALLPLSKRQIHELRDRFAVYLPDSGRINISGISLQKLDHLIHAFRAIL